MGRKYREYSYDDWKKAMDLHSRYKLGPTKISRMLDIKESTVKKWLYYGVIPLAAKWVAKPCIELAYVIGVLYNGDGSVSITKKKSQYKIQLKVIDKEFGETFSKAEARLFNKKYREPWWDKKQKQWEVKYYSKAFYEWYKKCEEKGLEGFKPYIEFSKETVRYYLKGLFDSEGSNNGNKQIYLYNSKKELLKYVQYLLKKYFDIKATGPYLRHEAGTPVIINGVETRYNYSNYLISIHRKLHIQKFLEEIGFTIVRKQLGLKKHEKVFIEGIGYVQPYKLVELGLFKLPFSDN